MPYAFYVTLVDAIWLIFKSFSHQFISKGPL